MTSADIDGLLERYLNLLDEYTRARDELIKLQADVIGTPPPTLFSTQQRSCD
jgi:hypothetical protein